MYARNVSTTSKTDVVAAIMAIHALGGLDYRPSAAELEIIKDRAQ